MARYRQFVGTPAQEIVAKMAQAGFSIFMLIDVDEAIMADPEVVAWADQQGQFIHLDEQFWHEIAERCHSYPHALTVDSIDSAILMVRDPDLALAFKLKFC